MRRRSVLPDRTHHPEAAVGAAILRRAVVAVRRPAKLRVVLPTAAAEDLVLAGLRTLRVLAVLLAVDLAVPVLDPLDDVTVHVVQPERVGLVAADLARPPQLRPPGAAAVRQVAVEVRLRRGG